jgi:hypothetical protein
LVVVIIYKLRTYQINVYINLKELTDFGGTLPSKLIQATSKPIHHSASESSFKKGRITFTALLAVVEKERSITMLLGVVDEGDLEVPDTFAGPARDP